MYLKYAWKWQPLFCRRRWHLPEEDTEHSVPRAPTRPYRLSESGMAWKRSMRGIGECTRAKGAVDLPQWYVAGEQGEHDAVDTFTWRYRQTVFREYLFTSHRNWLVVRDSRRHLDLKDINKRCSEYPFFTSHRNGLSSEIPESPSRWVQITHSIFNCWWFVTLKIVRLLGFRLLRRAILYRNYQELELRLRFI